MAVSNGGFHNCPTMRSPRGLSRRAAGRRASRSRVTAERVCQHFIASGRRTTPRTRPAGEDAAPARVPQRPPLEPRVRPQASVRVLGGRAADAPRGQMVSRRLCAEDAHAGCGSQAAARRALGLGRAPAARSDTLCRAPRPRQPADPRTPLRQGRGRGRDAGRALRSRLSPPTPRTPRPPPPPAGGTDQEPGAPTAQPAPRPGTDCTAGPQRGCYLAILSVQDMVTSCSPRRTPSHVCTALGPRTGTVPSPDSILVRRCPRDRLTPCLLPVTRRQEAV